MQAAAAGGERDHLGFARALFVEIDAALYDEIRDRLAAREEPSLPLTPTAARPHARSLHA